MSIAEFECCKHCALSKNRDGAWTCGRRHGLPCQVKGCRGQRDGVVPADTEETP